MDARLQRRVQRYGWDRAAALYEQAWQRPLEPAQAALLALAALEPGERVVDIACGTGLVTFAAADAVGPTGAVVGVDLSEAMVDHASATAHARDLTHVRFARMDAEDLLVPTATFDAALCALGLMYVPDALKAMQEMARVLIPGGRAIAAVWGQRNRCGWADIFPIVDAQVKSDVCPLFFSLGTADRLSTLFETAGLIDIETQRLATRLEWTSPDHACDAAFAGGPVALAYSRFTEETRLIVQGAYLESIARWRTTDGSYAVPGEFVIVAGRKPDTPGD
jgi:ubiquinone/menaquinone biosynthesis C-methylase UbiE